MRLTVVAGFAAASAVVGFAFGLAYFAMLRRSATFFITGRRWRHALALTLGRVGFAVLLLALAARLGPLTLLSAFAGLLGARVVALGTAPRAD